MPSSICKAERYNVTKKAISTIPQQTDILIEVSSIAADKYIYCTYIIACHSNDGTTNTGIGYNIYALIFH